MADAPETDAVPEDAQALLRRARVALRSGAVATAVPALEKAYALAAKAGDRALESEVLVDLARSLALRGKPDQALLCVDNALEAARAAGRPEVQAEACLLQSELLRGLGDGTGSKTHLVNASRLFDEATAAAQSARDGPRALELSARARLARDRLIETLAAGAPGGEPTLAERAAIETEARRKESERQRASALLEKLLQVACRILDDADPDAILATVLDGAIEITGAERGFVLLGPETPPEREPPGRELPTRELPGDLAVAVARNFDRAEVGRPEFKVSRTVIEKVLATGKPLVVHDASAHAELARQGSVRDQKLRSIVCVPFASSRAGGVHGALYLDNRFTDGAFAGTDLGALAAFAAHAAIAVENARLHQAARRERRALEASQARAEELAARLAAELSRTGDELGRVRARLDQTQSQLAERSRFGEIVGSSRSMQGLYRVLDKVKDGDVPLLVLGESGTGKELVARAIHFESQRRREPFISENCAAIPETLIESTLFGHEKGAFTGAAARRPGIFELAGAGTLFLDEIGELTAASQAKLLRVLQERVVRRVGGTEEISVTARVIAATNRDLALLVREGRFREDLYYRLKVLTVSVPPLRERPDDIPALLDTLFARVDGKASKKRGSPPIAKEALRALVDHSWPGNVRELENEVRRLHALEVERIGLADLSPEITGARAARPADASEATDTPVSLDEGERRVIVAALRATCGNKARAAELLAISRGTLWHRMRHHGLAAKDFS